MVADLLRWQPVRITCDAKSGYRLAVLAIGVNRRSQFDVLTYNYAAAECKVLIQNYAVDRMFNRGR